MDSQSQAVPTGTGVVSEETHGRRETNQNYVTWESWGLVRLRLRRLDVHGSMKLNQASMLWK
jgi:hypothetical protein